MSEASKDPDSHSDWDIIVGSIVVVLVVAGVVYSAWWFNAIANVQRDFQKAAALGDALGPATGFMSTVALIAAIASVLLQRRELQLQRKELQDTRAVLDEQKVAQEQLAKAQQVANVIAEERDRLQAISNRVAQDQSGPRRLLPSGP